MTEGATAPRQAWAAVLFSLIGASTSAYLYVGRPRRALAAAVTIVIFYAALATGLWGWVATPAGLSILGAAIVLATLFFAIDAIRIAARSQAYVLRPYNRTWIYVAAILATGTLSFVAPLSVRSFRAASASMEPTLLLGDRFLVDLTSGEPAEGDVIAFELPRDPRVLYVSRVVGMPGDTVQMVGGLLRVDGVPVTIGAADQSVETGATIYRETLPAGRDHLIADAETDGPLDDTAVFTVPPDAYFVMGDNRDDATDSRMPPEAGGIGFVPRANILGRATMIFWSDDVTRIGRIE